MGYGELEEPPTEAMRQILVPFLTARGDPAHQTLLTGISRFEATAKTVCTELTRQRNKRPASAAAAAASEPESDSEGRRPGGGKRARR